MLKYFYITRRKTPVNESRCYFYTFALPVDLDGDEYFVTWDPDLLPHLKNYDPMDYEPAPERKVEGVCL